jgi:hypothetical protein
MPARALALLFAMTLLSCDPCDGPSFVGANWECQKSGTVTISPPASLKVACPPDFGWDPTNPRIHSLYIRPGCPTDDYYGITIQLPPDGGPTSYALPSTDGPVSARFETATGSLDTLNGVEVTSGSVEITNKSDAGLTLSFTIEFRTNTGEVISVSGNVIASNCKLKDYRTCLE